MLCPTTCKDTPKRLGYGKQVEQFTADHLGVYAAQHAFHLAGNLDRHAEVARNAKLDGDRRTCQMLYLAQVWRALGTTPGDDPSAYRFGPAQELIDLESKTGIGACPDDPVVILDLCKDPGPKWREQPRTSSTVSLVDENGSWFLSAPGIWNPLCFPTNGNLTALCRSPHHHCFVGDLERDRPASVTVESNTNPCEGSQHDGQPYSGSDSCLVRHSLIRSSKVLTV